MKLLIVLIHNNNSKRSHYLLPKLRQLERELSQNNKVQLVEEYKQPVLVPCKTFITLLRKCYLWHLNREWLQYRDLKPRNILIDYLILFRRLVLTLVGQSWENKRTAIDLCVTNKHIECWNKLLKLDADFVVCFEDDAIFKPDSISRLLMLLKEIEKYKNRPVYIDLAGGCSLDELKVSTLEYRRDKNRIYYKKPVTNTACCYLISKKTAGLFIDEIIKHPWLRLIPIDWLVNKLLILTIPYDKYYTYHAYPPVFDHESLVRNYKSWL